MIVRLSPTGDNFSAAVKSFDANIAITGNFVLNADLKHRLDSNQGSGYIANDFLNLRVSRTKIENNRSIGRIQFKVLTTLPVQFKGF